MQDVQAVLVTILGIGFAVFLIMAIITVSIAIKILTNIRHITQRLDETTTSASEFMKYFGKSVGPAAASAVASVVARSIKNGFKRK
ncbi:hypothetical protein EPO04_00590 [Patescibacteria group bacterium]|nr:MAG: hypothetical protein EPO04_00590 [Patescibacteria group bacterium]